jgi:hypothetical protein
MKSSLRRKKVKWARRGGHALPADKDVEEVIEDAGGKMGWPVIVNWFTTRKSLRLAQMKSTNCA